MHSLFRDLIVVAVLFGAAGLLFAVDAFPGDSEIRALLQKRVDSAGQGVCIAVGLVDEHGQRVVGCGRPDANKTNEAGGDTVFEIGSITKVFTTLLLQDMVERGEMKLDDPVAKYLPAPVHVPTRGGRQITLLDLATHTSGLPRMPDNFKPAVPDNPYADYTPAQMYEFLSGYTLTRDIGAKYEYSNLGVTLLGHVIALKAGTNYESLVIDRICRPLKMDDTRIVLTPPLKARLAPGHDAEGKPASNWDFGELPGAGALRSTVNDMLKFVSANIGLGDSPLTPLMQQTHKVRFPAATPNLDLALGWHILHKPGADIIWHNGGTGGYHSYIGFDERRKLGVVVLCNSTTSIDDLALRLLATPEEVAEASKERKAIQLDAAALEAFAGRYELSPRAAFTIRRDGGKLTAQLTGQSFYQVFPESETNFFYKVVDAQLTFVKNDRGDITGLILHQNGLDQNAKKVN